MGRISVKETAKRMNVGMPYVRLGLQAGIFPFGEAVKISSRWTYRIDDVLLEKYLKEGKFSNACNNN